MNVENIKNKVALVVGGSGGIGSAIVDQLLADGFFVCATYAHEGQKQEALQKKFDGTSVTFHKMDMLDPAEIAATLYKIRQNHPKIDVLVYGPTLPYIHKKLIECTWADFEAQLQVQLRGMVEIIEQCKGQIVAKHPLRCVIILTAACVGTPPSHMSPYVTAKYALMGFAKTMSVELGRYGCTVNMISPGMVETGLLADFPAKAVEFAAAQNPSGKIGKPEDVAHIVSFLCSDAATHLNGVNLNLDGKEIV